MIVTLPSANTSRSPSSLRTGRSALKGGELCRDLTRHAPYASMPPLNSTNPTNCTGASPIGAFIAGVTIHAAIVISTEEVRDASRRCG